jgi:hypothetical protein
MSWAGLTATMLLWFAIVPFMLLCSSDILNPNSLSSIILSFGAGHAVRQTRHFFILTNVLLWNLLKPPDVLYIISPQRFTESPRPAIFNARCIRLWSFYRHILSIYGFAVS